MKVFQIHLGLLPIPPNGWGAVEKIIWEYYCNLNKVGLECEIKYLNDISYNNNTIVHVHVANLANECHKRKIPYIFTIHDHHAYLFGKESKVFKENLEAIENSVISTCPAKYLVDYFGSKKLRYFSHAVNTEQFLFTRKEKLTHKLLCVANNGYANNQSYDRKGFAYAIQAAKDLNLPIVVAGPSNNKKFFETLDSELNNYENLTKMYDLTENQLISLYNENTIFVHASELEAGHPNLTLLEAMSCGLPVVGTFEETRYDGMIVVERDVEQIKSAIKQIIDNYEKYQSDALNNAKNNSYKVRTSELVNLYDEYTEKIFGNKFINSYNSTIKKVVGNNDKIRLKLNFNDKPYLELENPNDASEVFNVKFTDRETNVVKYECNLQHGWWGACSLNYYIPYNIIVKSEKTGLVVNNYDLSLKDKTVLIEYDSASLGDQLAWMPIANQFKKKHNCNLFVNFPLNKIFEPKYPHIKFCHPSQFDLTPYATFKLGWYVDEKTGVNPNRHKTDPRKIPLQKIASDYLGLEYLPERPLLDFQIKERPIQNKYVTIATQSTAQAKYWNFENGWQIVVDYIKTRYNLEVICIDKHNIFGNGNDCINHIPQNSLDFTGDIDLTERMNQIYHSEFFIGLPSGLSWLSWALNKPTILISGFSYPYTEFETPYRVHNPNVCTGCWNDSLFDRGNWKWCPKSDKKELFECTKSITPDMVMNNIDMLIKNENL